MTEIRKPLPENFSKDLRKAYMRDNAMKAVIMESVNIGAAILPGDSYHEAYERNHLEYKKLMDRIVPEFIPEYAGTGASWEVDFDSNELVVRN